MGVGMIASVAGSALAGALANKGSKHNTTASSTSTTGPSAFQQPYIQQQFSGAQNTLNQNLAKGPYTGQLYAGVTPGQTAAAAQDTAFGGGVGNQMATSGASGLANLFNNATAYSGNAENMAANGVAGPNSGLMGTLTSYGTGAATPTLVNPSLSTALQNSAHGGLQSLNALNQNYQNIANSAAANPTQGILNSAAAYEKSAPVQSAIDATNAQINQQLGMGLAHNNAQEAATGNLNSSRAGAEQALEKQGAAIATGQADSGILNNAFNTGTSQALAAHEQGLNTALNATQAGTQAGLNTAVDTANLQNNMGQFNTSTQLSAANQGLGQQSAFENLNANTKLNANNQLGQGIFDAALGSNNVMNAGSSAAQQAAATGTLQQQNQQQVDNAAYQAYQNQINFPWQQYQNYAKLVDSPNYTTTNGSSTGTQQTVQNPLSTAYGAFQDLSGKNGIVSSILGSGNASMPIGSAISSIGSSIMSAL